MRVFRCTEPNKQPTFVLVVRNPINNLPLTLTGRHVHEEESGLHLLLGRGMSFWIQCTHILVCLTFQSECPHSSPEQWAQYSTFQA
jgi:hypothetical protein